ncbi:ubiquitin-like protein ISG15 [Amia ocellicauda]|uniref:ubiquitin-like protein ISG15 n=1 Tax=Amia ocellicauda TaxID=2972642 RepID=UPI0034645479
MQLKVKLLGGAEHGVDVEPSATVTQLKQKVQRLSGVPEGAQNLAVMKDGEKAKLENGKRLCDYGLSDGATVVMFIAESKPTEIFLKNHKGQLKPYCFSPEETVAEFLGKVSRGEAVAADQQYLTYQSIALDTNRKMGDYDIGHHSTVYQNLRLRGG